MSKSADSSTKAAAVGLTYVRELLPLHPSTPPESDLAAKLRLEMLAEIAEEVGPEQFLCAVKKAISLSRSRYDCTIFKIRECAGLQHSPAPSPAAVAWNLATQIFTDHCRTDAEGHYRLEERVVMAHGVFQITPAPEVPAAILRAIQSLGGWGALADRSNWGFKFRDFKDLYVPDSSPRRDASRGELARVNSKLIP